MASGYVVRTENLGLNTWGTREKGRPKLLQRLKSSPDSSTAIKVFFNIFLQD